MLISRFRQRERGLAVGGDIGIRGLLLAAVGADQD
jgi:hypothetical protein